MVKKSKRNASTLTKAQRLFANGHLEDALPLYQALLKQQEDNPDLLFHTGYLYYATQQYSAAIETLQKLIHLVPDHEEGRRMLLGSLNDGNETNAMLKMAHRIKDSPLNESEHLQAFSAFLSVCDWNNALPMLKRCIHSVLNGKISDSLLPGFLLNALGLNDITPETMYALTKKTAELTTQNIKPATVKQEKTHINNKINLAYLSSDFRAHPVGYFIYPIIASHNRDLFEIFCYSSSAIQDNFTSSIQKESDHFLDVSKLNETEVVERIKKDDIHILIELGGYTASSRLKIMAYHPAPVCIEYLGYPNSTGYTSIDYRITDPYVDVSDGTKYSETLLTLPQSFICFGMQPSCIRVEQAPVSDNGFITFGSFNHKRKLTPQVIEAWSTILKRVENSRLVLKGNWGQMIHDNIINEFKSHSVNAKSITILPITATYDEHVACYNSIDIALDTFPYTGTTTTCEALWMGVPVITLVGKTHQSRVSYSILKNIGFEETACNSTTEYIEKAVELSSRPENLSTLRPCLHTLFTHSITQNPKKFTSQLESLYFEACKKRNVSIPEFITSNTTPTTKLSMPNDVTIVLPETLDNIVTYVLTEQGDWYEDEIRFLRKFIKPNMHIIDAEAGYGCYSLSMAAKLSPQGNLFAFEIDPCKASLLQQSIFDNNYNHLALSTRNCSDKQINALAWARLDIFCIQGITPLNILKTCLHSLTNFSPLLLVNGRDDLNLNTDLLQWLRELNYLPYRLIPSLNILVPINKNFTPASWHSKIFFCKDDRAKRMALDGFLAKNILESVDLPNEPAQWIKELQDRPYTKHFLPKWLKQPLGESNTLSQALNAYTIAQKIGNSPEMQYGLLNASLSLLLSMDNLQDTPSRLSTLARIASEVGNFDLAINALQLLIENIKKRFNLNEPFLTVSQSYDEYDFENSPSNWMLAQALSQLMILQQPTSFNDVLKLIETNNSLQKLGFPNIQLQDRENTFRQRIIHKEDNSISNMTNDPPLFFNYQSFSKDITQTKITRKKRIQEANRWLSMGQKELQIALKDKNETHSTLFHNNIYNFAWTKEEHALINDLQAIATKAITECDINTYTKTAMAAMLYCFPHQFPHFTNLELLPMQFVKKYLDFILRSPKIFLQLGECNQYYSTMLKWLELTVRHIPTSKRNPAWALAIERTVAQLNGIPIYMIDGNTRSFYTLRARLHEEILHKNKWKLDYILPERPPTRNKIHLGIISQHLTPATETYGTLPIYKHLDHNKFDVTLFSFLDNSDNELQQYCIAQANHYIPLPSTNVSDAIDLLRQQNLDIVIFSTNATAVCNNFSILACCRFARIQIITASPTTTGMRHADYFISGALSEPENAQEHYSEHLMLHNGALQGYSLAGETITPKVETFSRNDLHIPKDDPIYISGANFYKILPETMDAWIQILERMPKALLLLYPFNPNWSNNYPALAFWQALKKHCNEHNINPDRIRIIKPRENRDDIYRILLCADVYLDSFPFTGSTSIIDPLRVSLPMVVMAGRSLRCRYAQSILIDLGLHELVAKDTNAYVNLAVNLGNNRNLRNKFAKRITEGMQADSSVVNTKPYGKKIQNILEEIATKHGLYSNSSHLISANTKIIQPQKGDE